ncbi:conserved hypothetical protein [Talaromyces stipitatus ATCC 10500]|uniref:Dephospho-CoA kinase n=1 Tax=Talaromyces stipitatus (strain ATCC 10500 / CBS 375.48 / QM 6759 / NRRL 1006) TaxID=441959 RepID=B8LXP6_TALSN|nr:uncharacterized protein TSTA_079040 [Talaromyces stipitatus ATCC 10500]EED24547.1 conserved hypothetical protein [Talaromyces stipitatus ATCC 10500]
MLYAGAINTVRSSSTRRLRLLILVFLLLCGFYWFTTESSSGQASFRKGTIKFAGSSGTRNFASPNWRFGGNSNGRSRQMEAPMQAAVPAPGPTATKGGIKKDLVVASMLEDNTTWLYDSLPDWHKSIYVVDDKYADLTVATNKGRESMVYLTYIIDNYDHLPDYMLFIHSQRYQWHNDDPYYDGVPMIKRFQLPYLEMIGYVNLRCAWVLGCPEEIHPMTDTDRDAVHAGPYFYNGFKELFPGVKVPDTVAVSCCAQFGVARWKIRERPKSDYERYRKWLLNTDLDDDMSGRIMEYSWHTTGKSTVSSLLSSPPHNLPIIDADVLARKVVEPGTAGYKAIANYFGPSTPDLLLPPDTDGKQALNRPALGRRVFGDSEERKRDRTILNKIVHPAVRWEVYKSLLYYYLRGNWAVVLDVPLLFESGMDVICGTVIVVAVKDPAAQMARLRARDPHLTAEDAENRVKSQGDVQSKVKKALYRNRASEQDLDKGSRGVIVWNDGDKVDLAKEVDKAILTIQENSPRWWSWVLLLAPPVGVAAAVWNMAINFGAQRSWDQKVKKERAKL